MILVDTSVWINHLRASDPRLSIYLEQNRVLGHAFVTGEIALGTLRRRDAILDALNDLPQAPMADHEEVMWFIARRQLFGIGIGYVDAHLLAAASLCRAELWTRDKKLLAAAKMLALAAPDV